MRDDNEAFVNDKDSAGRKPGMRKTGFKKKVCKFCQPGAQKADYKNPDMLRRYITERGKILPARITGTCAKHQTVRSFQQESQEHVQSTRELSMQRSRRPVCLHISHLRKNERRKA